LGDLGELVDLFAVTTGNSLPITHQYAPPLALFSRKIWTFIL